MAITIKTGSMRTGMTYGHDQLRVKLINRLNTQSEAGGYVEYWRIRSDTIERGIELISNCGFGPYIRWDTIPFLSSFLLERRRQELSQDPNIPF